MFATTDPAKSVQRGSLDIPGVNAWAVPLMADAGAVAVHPYYWGVSLIQVKPDVDSIDIDAANSHAIIANGRAWLTGAGHWWSGGGLKIINLSDPENLVAYDHELKGNYPRVIGARGAKAFVNFSGGTACYDASTPGDLKLDGFRHHYAWPDRIRFKDDWAYLALGYYGVWVKDL